MHVSSSDHCDRTILSTVSIFAKGQINEERLLGNVESWQNCIWQTLQTSCEEDCFVADAAVLRLPGILSLPGITLPSIELLPCWKKNFCPSSMSCQCCYLIGHSCSNRAHIHQYWRKSTHAGVSQWHLWANHSLQSFHFRKGLDQWGVSSSQCWKLRKLELGRHLRPRVIADAAELRLPGILSLPGMIRASNIFCHAGRKNICPSSMYCPRICEAIQITTIHSTEERADMRVPAIDHCERTILSTVCIFAKGQTMLKPEKTWVWQTPQTLFWEDSWLLMLLSDGFQESCCYQESRCQALNSCHAKKMDIGP